MSDLPLSDPTANMRRDGDLLGSAAVSSVRADGVVADHGEQIAYAGLSAVAAAPVG